MVPEVSPVIGGGFWCGGEGGGRALTHDPMRGHRECRRGGAESGNGGG